MVTTLEEIKEKAIPILKEAGVTRAGVFGSFARGEQGPESDVDILVQYGRRTSLLDAVGIQRALSDVIGRKVDLVSENGLSPYMKDRVFAERVPLC